GQGGPRRRRCGAGRNGRRGRRRADGLESAARATLAAPRSRRPDPRAEVEVTFRTETAMTDADFPSGAWNGFFMQPMLPGRHEMNMHLTFERDEIRGGGDDWVGAFTVEGEYNSVSGECRWTKQYVGKHAVSYVGRNEGEGIWGVWELSQLFGLLRGRGVFHIWPRGRTPKRDANLTELAGRATGMLAPNGVAVVV